MAVIGPEMGEVWFEIIRIGNSTKVSAVHVQSDTEVCLVVPSNTTQEAMKAAALRKLAFVMKRA